RRRDAEMPQHRGACRIDEPGGAAAHRRTPDQPRRLRGSRAGSVTGRTGPDRLVCGWLRATGIAWAGPSRAGRTKSVQNSVAASEIANSSPISAVPGSFDSARLRKADMVVSALKNTARAVLDCR